MKKIFLIMLLIGGTPLWADELKPPVPAPAGDGLDVLPPPVDINQLPLPNVTPSSEPSKSAAPTNSAQAPPPLAPEAAVAPTKTPLTKKKVADIEKPSVQKPAPETAAPAPAVSSSAPKVSLGAFADYFPNAVGTKWTYEYLKAAPGTTEKKTRRVEVTAQEPVGNGLQVTFQVTQDGKTTEQKYSLGDNKVAQISEGTQVLNGEYAYQLPEKGSPAHWTSEGKTCKASFGEAEVYKKKYRDCVIVVEKSGASTVYSYYAKGIGLVSVEFYGKGMKLNQIKSFAYVSGAN